MERPKFNDEMRKELAQIVGKIVFDWCNGETDLDTCVKDSEEILRFNHNENGYTLAKEFDDKGYSPDAMLVDDLDCVSNQASVILKKYIEKWVKDNNLALDIEIGTEVKYNEWKDRYKIGKVVKLYPETMQYGVRTPDQSETSHYIVNFEKVSRAVGDLV